MPPSNGAEKFFFLLKKNSSLSFPEFTTHWLYKHAPLLSGSPTYRKYRSRYVQNHLTQDGLSGEHPPPFDGVTEVWVDASSIDAPPFGGTAEYQSSIRPDEALMLDRRTSIVLKTTESVIVPQTAPCKVMIFPCGRPGTPQDVLVSELEQSAGIFLAQDDFARNIKGYKLNQLAPGSCTYMTGEPVPPEVAFSGVIEMWFDSPEIARVAFQTAGYRTAVQMTESNGLLAGADNAGFTCFVQEHEIFG